MTDLAEHDAPTRRNGRVSGQRSDDAVELMASGQVRATINQVTHTLKRPSIGEFRLLREFLNELADAAKPADGDDKPAPADQTDELLAWQRQAFELLADRPIDTDNDDLPAWMADPSLPAILIGHWRQVPVVRGVR